MAGEMARLWDNSDPAGSVPAAGLWLRVRIEEAGRPKGEALSAGAPVEGSGGGRQRLHTEGSWCGVGRPGCARTRVCLSFLSVTPSSEGTVMLVLGLGQKKPLPFFENIFS